MENNTTKNLELVFIPCPAPGHIVSTAEFANRILSHHPKFNVTVLLIRSPWTNFPSARPQQVKPDDDNQSSSADRIRYIDLPEVNPPPEQLFHHCPEEFVSIYIASHKPHVTSAINTSISNSSTRLAGIVVDMFSTSMIDVANEMNIPSYLFFTSTAAFLGMILDLPSLNIQYNEEDGWISPHDSDTELSITTFANPFPATVLPSPICNNKSGLQVFTNHGKRYTETKGIILNTFTELESYATNSLSRRQNLPPIYTIGPVLDLKGQAHQKQNNFTQKQRIIKWLDNQPDTSVIFLCFGSGGSFTEQQLTEIANGLQQTGIRFLWSLRKPPTGENIANPGEYTDEEINRILPNEFISSLTEEGRGMLCGWTPQVDVLAHKAVGGFVSHCGWNSTLESVWFGKPIVTWPLYAEQHCNAFQIVKELGLGVELRLDYRREKGDIVTADEIGKAVKCVMEDRELRKRVEEIEVISKRVLMDGGSSFIAMECLLKDMETNLGV